MSLLTIDVGGTSIKYALFRKGALSQKGSFPTPTSLTAYYEVLTELVKNYEQLYQITGVAISSPGAVNKTTGAIEGASALPYIFITLILEENSRRDLSYLSQWKTMPTVRHLLS